MSTSEHSVSALPTGDWSVDPKSSELLFSVKTFWGLLPVKGNFSEFEGALHVDAAGASGTLTIQSASLDTKNAKRDTHLRSADFFNVEQHPTITFTLAEAESAHGHVHFQGTLGLPGGEVPLTLHADVDTDNGLSIHAGTAITREEAHMTWNQLGMIRNEIVLIADLVLTPA